MQLVPKYRLAFVGIPKCGTNTVYGWMSQYETAKRCGSFHNHNIGRDVPPDFRVFTVVRDPMARAQSIYASVAGRARAGLTRQGKHVGMAARYPTFSSFCLALASGARNEPTQWDFIKPNFDRLIILELSQLERHLITLCRDIDMPFKPVPALLNRTEPKARAFAETVTENDRINIRTWAGSDYKNLEFIL